MAIRLSGDTANTYGVLQVANATVTTDALYVSVANGNIGLGGNSTPAHDVSVQGSFNATGAASVGTTLSAGNTTVSGFVNATSTVTGTIHVSTVANGTAPLTVASSTKVTNLNADYLDGYDYTAFAFANQVQTAIHSVSVNQITGELDYTLYANTGGNQTYNLSSNSSVVMNFVGLPVSVVSVALSNLQITVA